MTISAEISDDEEPSLPEKYTKSELLLWSSKKTKQTPSRTSQIDVISDARGLLRSSEQHQQGLSIFMKRCRRDIIQRREKPELVHVPNPSLPSYLQDVERYNCDLMHHVELKEHCTLPTKSTIEDEKKMIKAEGKKLWSAGRILHHNPSLVDPNWKKGLEETTILQEQKQARQRMAHVILGVLDRWQETQEKGAGADPVTPVPTTLDLASSRRNEDESEKIVEERVERDSNIGKKVLETVPEAEEETDENLVSSIGDQDEYNCK